MGAMMTFVDKLRAAQTRADSWLCIGLDTDADKVPPHSGGVVAFNRTIIQATYDLVCAYKPNLAFYLARGSAGIDDLMQTVNAIPRDTPVILDAKFGDIESSARGYARFAFETLGVDAVTVSPYLGADALAPFLDSEDHAVFLLAHTSNPTARDLQEAHIAPDDEPLYIRVARYAKELTGLSDPISAHIGLVVGATFPQQLQAVRAANPAAVFLVPGIGAQGGNMAETVEFGSNSAGIGSIINASRSIVYASSGADYAQAARVAAIKLRDDIRSLRKTQALPE